MKTNTCLFNDKLRERILWLIKEKNMTMAEVAKAVGVSERSLYVYAKNDAEFKKEIIEARSFADDMVKISLWQRAVGYSHDSEKIFMTKDGDIVRAKTVEHYPPDVPAGKFWLTNRDPEKWKEKTEVKHSGSLEQISDEEIDRRYNELMAKAQSAQKKTKPKA